MTKDEFDELLDDATHAVAKVVRDAGVKIGFVDYGDINDALCAVLRDLVDMEEVQS
jgi:hypothetical protein